MIIQKRCVAATLLALESVCAAGSGGSGVQLWETNQVIPTYLAAPPDPNPRFYNGRTYQGARATFYPYPVSDRLTDVREEKNYRTVMLANEYVELSVLPELGGRIFSARDKTDGYDFFYHQHVVKPALIGMLGAWISGGVEWNVPHHHRATSFMPVDYQLQDNADGSKTVWVGETELRHRLRWLVGLTLYPGRSYVEMSVKLVNPTPFAHSFLFWINPAVHANDQYQVIFPPDTEFAVQHGKPEFVEWPIAHTIYGGVDYSRGVDISWWKNHPSPGSFFAWNSEQDFFGGYDHGQQAGVLHFADHHVVVGKKFFEWGNGADGERWSKILTDTDGPYLELMAGAFSDNQPDYSWCQPGEVKTWRHYWYPLRQLGGVKNATLDAAVNLEQTNGVARLALNATTRYTQAQAWLHVAGKPLFVQTIDIGPGQPFTTTVSLPPDARWEDLRASLRSAEGRELVAYQPVLKKHAPMPTPVKRPLPPKEIKANEELYLTGLRIEQLYSPSFEAAPYYEEAIRRDPGDYRANTALGVLLCKQWRWTEAEARLNTAIARAAENYIRPKDGEALYYLGVALRGQGKLDAAYDAFRRACWSAAWQAAGYQALAELECRRSNYLASLEFCDRSLAAGAQDPQARNLKAAVLRHLDRAPAAEEWAAGALALDPLDFRAANEVWLAQQQQGKTEAATQTLTALIRRMRGAVASHLELAVAYGAAGLWSEAMEILRRQIAAAPAAPGAPHSPLISYFLAYYGEQAGRAETAAKDYLSAAQMPPDFCFPFQHEAEPVLRHAAQRNPQDARAPYYLGNLLFDRQPAEAVKAWELARDRDPGSALVHRNLGLAYAQMSQDFDRAVTSMEKALAINSQDSRLFYELDVLYEAAGASLGRRLEALTRHQEVVAQRDDIMAREIVLLTAAGEFARAVQYLQERHFHNWEGSGEIHNIYADALLRRGWQASRAKHYAEALKDYEAALEYPANLEVGRPYRDRQAALAYYHIATAHQALGDPAKARSFFERTIESRERNPSETQYYQARALRELGRDSEARELFNGLVSQGKTDTSAGGPVDYFAKFGERQSERARQARAHYLAGLGHLGLGETADAKAEFAKALEANPSHVGANVERRNLAP